MTKKFAIVFPGQGSQSVGMLADYAIENPIIKDTFAQASKILNYDLWSIVQNGPEEKLNQTAITQPALLAASVAIWHVWQQKYKQKPTVLAGHSLGEYSALVCSGVIDFSDAIYLVAERGRCMQEAVPAGQGAMAAIIGIEDKTIQQWCDEIKSIGVVVPANYNAPGQIVIAGQTAAVEKLVEKAKAAGSKLAKCLNVSVPAHSPLMDEAAKQFAKVLEKIHFHKPNIPVIHNVNLASYTEENDIKKALIAQLTGPVRWTETIQLMSEHYQVKLVFECGPGKVLTNLIKRIDPLLQLAFSAAPAEMNKAGDLICNACV